MQKQINLHFLHEAPTPHNNYLLDQLASVHGLTLFRHYLLTPTTVPGRPWKKMGCGEVQVANIKTGYGKWFSFSLLRLAITDKKSVFFVIGWDSPLLVFFLLILCLRKRPLLMWDDGPTEDALKRIKQYWRPRQACKSFIIKLINQTPGTYFYTGEVKKANILRLGLADEKLTNMPFFVKPGRCREEFRSRHLPESTACFILAGGRLTFEKGYDTLIKALGIVFARNVRNWRCVLVGSGAEKENLLGLTSMLGISLNVDFLDWAEPEDFSSYVHSADLFIAPARFDHFPTTVISAMQAGVAVIATDRVGSAIEFIRANENGLLLQPDEPEQLADSIIQLIEDPLKRQKLGDTARKTMLEWPVERGVDLILKSARKAMRECAV